ncbi:MAG: hypothetical protein V4813_12675 [Gemmatimonadota bacterium]
MSNLLPVTTPRARTENAPERRSTEPTGTDFASSLASVRGQERSAGGQARAAAVHVRNDERRTARSEERTVAAQSRSQVQALMLSGAMKFAATRSADAVTRGTVDTACQLPQDVAEPTPAAVAATIDVPTVIEAETPPIVAAASAIAEPMTEPTAGSDASVVAAPAADMTASAAATAAAMQLVASLPITDVAVVVDEMPVDVDAFEASDNDAAAMQAWAGRMAAATDDSGAPMLVEDHFDAPAAAASSQIHATDSGTTQVGTAATSIGRTVTDTVSTTPVATAAAARNETQTVERDTTPLAPKFRERLQRVMDRMKREFGHDVTVVETIRSQARQDALFAQGRTAPGPVVTWTRQSKHAQGMAADLVVDGAWQNPAGYAHLAQVAKQEGLRTLGARDPGHVELPSDSSVSGETLSALLSDLQGDAGDTARKVRADVQTESRADTGAAMARVANVAQVARVATVAQVARVATVARPGAAPAGAATTGGEPVSPLAMSALPAAALGDMTGGARVAAPIGNVNMADRISHLMDLQATQAAKPLNSVLLRMDNVGGIEDQIRIDTRGTAVDARLGLGNAQQAAELSGRVNELREALERRGLTADGVRVQAAPRATDSVNFTRPVTPAMEVAAMRAAAEEQAQGNTRDQSSRDQQQREAFAREQDRPTPRPSSDDARHRSRREQPEDRR